MVVTCKGNGRKEVQQDSFAPKTGSWGSSLNAASVCLVSSLVHTDKGSQTAPQASLHQELCSERWPRVVSSNRVEEVI